jgi:hypothetical protein
MLGRSRELRAPRSCALRALACSVSEAMRPAVEHDLALAELFDQVRIVRGDDHRDADFLEALETFITSTASAGSRLPVGSSAISSCGLLITARAMPTRCCSPTDSSERRGAFAA